MAIEVVDDEREPRSVLSRPDKSRHRQVPGDDQRVQVGQHPRLPAVQSRRVSVEIGRRRLDEEAASVRAADPCRYSGTEAARLSPGLDHGRAAGPLDRPSNRLRNILPGDPGAFGGRRAHPGSLRAAGELPQPDIQTTQHSKKYLCATY